MWPKPLLWGLVVGLWAGGAWAGELRFRRHDLNPESQFCACAAVDVNRDGRLDVVSGAYWYQAPTWQRHSLRDVPMIRGRYDDYSNLPLDIDADGWTDLVSANYRSRTLYWIQHPGPQLGPWRAHVVATPGPMETARLYDIDGDGRLDVLPNGTTFAAWWEVRSGPDGKVAWVRHDLPEVAAGHGIGFGDLNGDGRGDIVCPKGWLEAPEDPRAGAWRFHPDFTLDGDASVPILVLDVDGDGDNDLLWGRGHDIGLYWLEQDRKAPGVRWVRHAIDTRCSQAHALVAADLDGDGRTEIVAGKRYLGHEGRDPGELDPLGISWYRFEPKTRTFSCGTISSGGRAGWGLDPKAVDLDGDGDVDLLAADRSGLYWFENLCLGAASQDPGQTLGQPDVLPANSPGKEAAPTDDDHRNPLQIRDPQGQLRDAATPAEWTWRRARILHNVQVVMGSLPGPERRVPLDVRIEKEERTPHYRRLKLTFAAEPGDRVPAYLLVPHDTNTRRPAALCLHQTIAIGKGEPAGLGGRPTLHYAHELANRGYVCIVPDYPSFGEYPYDFRKHPEYASGSMKAIWNNHRAVDLLETLPEVDTRRIVAIGHSLGGHNALFTAVFDQRIRAVISSCGFTAFHNYYGGKLAGWTSDRYMPRIREVYGNDPDRVPFDFHELLAALAPRPVFVNAPLRDDNFDCTGVKRVMAAAAKVYRLWNAESRLHVEYPDAAHDFPDPVRLAAYQWLDRCWKNLTR